MTTIPELAIINGGVSFEAKKRDGTSQTVFISQIPLRKLERYAALQGDEAALVEFFCDQPEGWDDILLPESHLEILRIGEELNSDPFDEWIVRLRDRLAKTSNVTTSLLASLPKESRPQ